MGEQAVRNTIDHYFSSLNAKDLQGVHVRGASPVLVSDDRCRRRFARRRVARLVALAFCQLPVGRHDRQYLGVADMFDTWEWLICSKGLLCRRAVLASCWRRVRLAEEKNKYIQNIG